MPAVILDHHGNPMPSVAPSRARRMARLRYDAAQTVTDNSNHWANADSLSAAAANSPEVRQKLRDRSRYECANNTYAAGMVRTFATDIIGTGPRLQMQTGSKEDDSAIEMSFWKWTVATRFSDKLRTMRMAQTRDGEAFGVFVTNMALRHPVKLDLRLHEAEQVASPYQMHGDSRNEDGILFDDFGNPVAYNLLRHHPGDATWLTWTTESELVAARDVLHLFRRDRPGQVRGIPEITAALPLYAQLRRFTLAVIAAAETAADIAGFIQTQASPDNPDELEPLDALDIQKRMLMTLPRGWSISQLRAEQPATTYAMFKREVINEIARVLGMPYNIAAGDSSSYNYSSGRLDHKTYYKLVRVERAECESECLEQTLGRWWDEARRLAGVVPDAFRASTEPPMHTWGWDGDEHIDPKKEAEAQRTRLETCMTTYAAEYGVLGLDWEDQLRQRAKEEGLRKELGLPSVESQPVAQPQSDMDAMAQRVAELVLEELTT